MSSATNVHQLNSPKRMSALSCRSRDVCSTQSLLEAVCINRLLPGRQIVTYTRTSELVSYAADSPEIDSCNTSYKLALAPSAGGQTFACSSRLFIYLAADSETESFPPGWLLIDSFHPCRYIIFFRCQFACVIIVEENQPDRQKVNWARFCNVIKI